MTNIDLIDKKIRVDIEFVKELRMAKKRRAVNFPDEDILSDREITRMLKNTAGFEKSTEELIKSPRKTK